MGRGTWWLPGWLSRVVPNVDIEGRALTQEIEAEEAPPAPLDLPPAPAD
jgi:RND superfamily putative drug exporter